MRPLRRRQDRDTSRQIALRRRAEHDHHQMSKFQEAHTVSSLKGAPPGYVVYGEGGRLTERCAGAPTASSFWTKWKKRSRMCTNFFQVFDERFMDDGNGRRIDFKNTLIILTTNVGTKLIVTLAGSDTARIFCSGLRH